MARPGPILIGGRYALLHQLGAGGMASVWLAADRRLNDKRVAVKRLHGFRPDSPGAAQDIERARREAYAASRLSHPNLVAVTDFIADRGEPFIVMEFVDGTTMERLVERGPLPFDEAARLVGQVASALGEAHAAHIVHRDIKPANIIVTPRGDAKLADFGIARSQDDPRFTRTGSFTGTMRYLAPEVLDGADPDPAADVWALGATLFEAVEGRPAFDASSNVALMAAIMVGPLPEVTCAPALAPLLTRLLHRDPAARPSAAEVAARLRSLATPTRDRAERAAAPFVADPPRSGPPVAPEDATRMLDHSGAPPFQDPARMVGHSGAPPFQDPARIVGHSGAPPFQDPARMVGHSGAPQSPRPGARPKRRTRAWMVVAVPAVVAAAAGVAIAISTGDSGSPPLAGGRPTGSTSAIGPSPTTSARSSTTESAGSSPTASGPVSFDGVTVRNPTDLTRSPAALSRSSSHASAIRIRDLVQGTGRPAAPGATVSVCYAGLLYSSGAVFDTTWVGNNDPRTFALRDTLPGFAEGVGGSASISAMHVGGRRIVIIPARLAYGSAGSGSTIPPNADLVYVVDLRDVT